jgi:hypothetical protein
MAETVALTGLTSLRFAIAGRVTAWDPIDRCLQMGPCTFWLVSTVCVSGVVPGIEVMVSGHVEPPSPRWIVTALKVEPPPRLRPAADD